MNNVNGITSNNGVTTINPAEISKQDLISAVYLERGEMLDTEVRRIVNDIDKSNQYVQTINGLIAKADRAEFGATTYTEPTWTTGYLHAELDNYNIKYHSADGGQWGFTLTDREGNQLIYQNRTLIPVPKGATVDVLEVGIPVMNDMTLVLADGTEITFLTTKTGGAFNSSDLSGGLADITGINFKRGNQTMKVVDFDVKAPALPTEIPPFLETSSNTTDSRDNDGYVLVETDGVHAWEYEGRNVKGMTRANPNDASDQLSGYFARKLAFESHLDAENTINGPAMTEKERELLRDILKIPYRDASGTGRLTTEEWKALKKSLFNARDNLNGNSQLQTVQLQRAMQTYNQNFEAMSNAQQKIYSLLRDIISNVK